MGSNERLKNACILTWWFGFGGIFGVIFGGIRGIHGERIADVFKLWLIVMQEREAEADAPIPATHSGQNKQTRAVKL